MSNLTEQAATTVNLYSLLLLFEVEIMFQQGKQNICV